MEQVRGGNEWSRQGEVTSGAGKGGSEPGNGGVLYCTCCIEPYCTYGPPHLRSAEARLGASGPATDWRALTTYYFVINIVFPAI